MIKPVIAGILFFLISMILAVLIFFLGAKIGFNSPSEKITVWASLTVVAALLFLLPVIIHVLWANWANQLSRRRLMKPNGIAKFGTTDSTQLVDAAYRWEQLKQFYQLTSQYKDHRKPWILVIGSDDILEKTFPGIKDNFWIESPQAFWLDAQGIEPVGGWNTLRGHNKCPAEGIVCLNSEQNKTYQFGEQLQTLFAKLNWLLPVNLICINQTESSQVNSVVSHVLKNHEVSKDKIHTELTVFVQELKALGTIAIERKSNHRFIANLSKTLETEIIQLADAISADKKILGKSDSVQCISFIEANGPESVPALIFKSFDMSHVFGKYKKLKCSQSDYIYWGLSALALLLVGMFAHAANHSQQHMLQFQSKLVQLRSASTTKSKDSMVQLLSLQNEIIDMEKTEIGFATHLTRIIGYDHRKLLLDKAYEQYGQSAQEIIYQPIVHQLTSRLNQLNSLSAQELSTLSDEGDQYYNVLKTYLMLTEHTDKIEPEFLIEQLLPILKQQGINVRQAKRVAAFFFQQFIRHKT